MTPKEKIDKLDGLIRRIVNKDNKMEGRYNMTYSTSDDDYTDWKVKFKVSRVILWETENYVQCKYSGSVYLDVDVMVGFEGDWEENTIWDLPSWVKEDIENKILDNIEQFIPMVCVDLTFD
jgi:hypothetical protein